jgi:tetratricopeptide (TPR) repeat protein
MARKSIQTYAVCKADMILKGEGARADHSAHAKLRHYDAAIRDLTEAIRHNRFDPSEEYYNRGQAYAALRQYAKAISDYSEVIRLRTRTRDISLGDDSDPECYP